MAFTQNFNYCLEQKNYSAYRFAQIIGASNQGVLNWQSGKAIPYTKTRRKIAEYFGITLEELDGDELPVLPPEGAKKVPAREDEDDLREDQKIMANLLKRMTVEERKNFINAAVAALKE